MKSVVAFVSAALMLVALGTKTWAEDKDPKAAENKPAEKTAAAPTAAPSPSASKSDTHLYELRVYTVADGEGMRERMNKVFKDKVLRLFDKHAMKSVGYWNPTDEKSNKFYYMLVFDNRDAREKAWKEFKADPEWTGDAAKDFKVDDKNLAPESQVFFMHLTDYSPALQIKKSDKPRVFELRTYTTNAGRLENLHARFRDHTAKLFEKHGMTNIAYWEMESQQIENKKQLPANDPANTLIYFLAHDSEEAKNASFKAFVSDPQWKTALEESEKKAGGPLTVSKGVKSVLMKAADYSPLK